MQKFCIDEIVPGYNNQGDHCGQPIDPENMEFVQGTKKIYYGRCYGNEILAQAIPYDVRGYLHAADDKHCCLFNIRLPSDVIERWT